MTKTPSIFNATGNPINPTVVRKQPTKNMAGLYGNIFSYPNYGRYRPRFYTLGDNSQGMDTLSRELVVRWSREMTAQLPFIKAAVNALADFSVGDAYFGEYHGKNKEWWKQAEAWLFRNFYPNANVRGSNYDFQTSLKLESTMLDIDGDYLCILGKENDMPKYQIIPNNRIRSNQDNQLITDGKLKGTIISDGVYYTPQGKAVAFNVQNATNLVNNAVEATPDLIFSIRDASLVVDPVFMDKLRGVPSIGSAILQAISIQELDQYLMEKIKIQSTIALVEKTPSGEAPLELQQTLEALNQQATEYGGFNPAPNTHAVDIVQGSQIRYVHAEGGEITMPTTSGPNNEGAEYMARLETQVLSTLGIPHQLIYSTDKTTGRITSGIAEIMRKSVARRQKVLDKTAKLRIAWALSVAMDNGDIPRNDSEIISDELTLTHPPEFTLDRKYENQIIIENYNNGISTLNDTTTKLYNRSADDTLDMQAQEQIKFYTKVKEVSEKTGMDTNVVITGWRTQNHIPSTSNPPTDSLTTQE